jgi:hypothetical protein
MDLLILPEDDRYADGHEWEEAERDKGKNKVSTDPTPEVVSVISEGNSTPRSLENR